MNEFGRRLKLLREENKLTLAEMAEKLNTTKSNLSRYENGKVDPALNVVIDYAKYFGVSLDWMAGTCDIKNRYSVVVDCKKSEKLNAYEEAINKCKEANISPDKLNQLIEVLQK